ncbi:hypothetical protein VCHA37P191_120045 [Vibrio chagasii]|nr:hypothetical protein VCHA37P191_120045 [Vibrio chagasii]CAH6949697.1 hypothetical protein VCHA49P380_130045 [Vibrio chagasii]
MKVVLTPEKYITQDLTKIVRSLFSSISQFHADLVTPKMLLYPNLSVLLWLDIQGNLIKIYLLGALKMIVTQNFFSALVPCS